MDELWQRLKQRKLVLWTIGYTAFTCSLIQVLDVVSESYHWPDHAMHMAFGVLLLGFVVMLILAWFHGERGVQQVTWPELLLLALALGVGGGLFWHFGRIDKKAAAAAKVAAAKPASSAPTATAARIAPATFVAPAAPVAFNPPADSIVVLPFANLGGDKSQQYFSDGITEELTGALGQNPALRVIAWDTASTFRDPKRTATDIGKQLNVANLLHGSIARAGGQVRVTAELVNTITGYELWSDHYDDSLKNIFQVQDKISAAIADALKVKFAAASTHASTQRTVNPQAHDLVLQAVALMDRARTAAPYEQARQWLEQAIALAPDYAEAHAQQARALYDLTQFSTLSLQDALPKIRDEARKALALDPDNVAAIIVLANADLAEGNSAKARAGYERAIRLDPSNAYAHLDYANVLLLKPSLAETLEAVQLDPENTTAQTNLAGDYLDLGEYAQALPILQAQLRLTPHNADGAFELAKNYALLHRNEDAAKAFDLAQPDTPLAKQLTAAGKLAYQSVLDPKWHAQALVAVDALRRRTDLDPESLNDVIQLYLVLDKKDAALALLPQYCAAAPVGCSDLSVNPVGLLLHGDPRFEALVKKYDTTSQPPASATSAPSSP